MTRGKMVAVFKQEMRKAYTRRKRIAAVHGVWGDEYQRQDGVIDGIIKSAEAFGITYDEIEEEAI